MNPCGNSGRQRVNCAKNASLVNRKTKQRQRKTKQNMTSFQPVKLDALTDTSTTDLQPFYRAMHFSAKRGIAIACRLSVRPSVRL